MNIPDHVAPLVRLTVFATLGFLVIALIVSPAAGERRSEAVWLLWLITGTLASLLLVMVAVLYVNERWMP